MGFVPSVMCVESTLLQVNDFFFLIVVVVVIDQGESFILLSLHQVLLC